MGLKNLTKVMMHGIEIYKASPLQLRKGEPIAEAVQRETMACMVCGARPGTHLMEQEAVCDLHVEK